MLIDGSTEQLGGLRSLDVRAAKPQLLTSEIASGARFLVTLGCGEAFARVALGLLQIFGASLSVMLLLMTGASPVSLANLKADKTALGSLTHKNRSQY